MTIKKCILCGYKMNVPWGHTDLTKHENVHTSKRFLGYAEAEDEGECPICGGVEGDHEDDCDNG